MIPLNAVLQPVYAVLRNDTIINSDDILEFAAHALEDIRVYKMCQKSLCFLRVDNYKTKLPLALYGVEAVYYVVDIDCTSEAYNMILSTTTACTSSEAQCTVTSNNLSTVYTELGKNTSIWKPLRYNTDGRNLSLFQSNCVNLAVHCEYSFSFDLQAHSILTTFQKGYLAVVYFRAPMNDEGDFLIPDSPEVIEAIRLYCMKKIWEARMNMREDGAGQIYKEYSQQYEVAFARAVGNMMMPTEQEYLDSHDLKRFFWDMSPFAYGLGNLGTETVRF